MTDEQKGKLLQHGTSVRIKIPGVNGTAGYLITKTKRTPYRVQGNWWVSVEGHPGPVPVRDIEVIQTAGAEGAF